jgi:hypothetical protein
MKSPEIAHPVDPDRRSCHARGVVDRRFCDQTVGWLTAGR